MPGAVEDDAPPPSGAISQMSLGSSGSLPIATLPLGIKAGGGREPPGGGRQTSGGTLSTMTPSAAEDKASSNGASQARASAQGLLFGDNKPAMSRISERFFRRASSRGSNRANSKDSNGDAKEEEGEEHWGYCWLLEEIVEHPRFEASFAALIIINSLIMALQSQYSGIQVGYEVGYPGSTRPARTAWPLAAEAFGLLEQMFATCFVLELLAKLVALRVSFFRDRWNILDFLTVVSWLVDSLGGVLPFPPMLLRLARLVRLLRLLRLVRRIQTFDSLYIMTASIKGSAYALIWSTILLCVVQMVIALWLHVMVQTSILDESEPLELRLQTYKYYGTFTRCVMTMFELTLANWIDPARVLFDNVSEWYIFFILSHQLIIGFAMVKVITGVFLHETFKVASTDDTIMLAENERATKFHKNKINDLLEKGGDSNGDGLIDKDEFSDMMADPDVRTWMAAMGLNVRDANLVFKLIDDEGTGEITPERLVAGLAKLKGNARSIDLNMMIKGMDETKDMVKELRDVMTEKSLRDGPLIRSNKRQDTRTSNACPTKSVRSNASKKSGTSPRTASKKSTASKASVRSINATLQGVGKLRHSGLLKIVTSPTFEVFFVSLIVLSALTMAAQGQYEGLDAGYRIGYRTTTRPASEVMPGAPAVFEACEWTFGVIFAVELVLKIIALRCDFFRDVWSNFDFVVVVAWVVGRLDAASLPLDPLVLRMCRLMRLARLLRLVKTIRGFDSLYLMVTALKGSCAALTWSTVLLFVIQMMLALILNEVLYPFIMDTTKDEATRHQVYKYYGTFSRSMLTMFEITLANWAPACRVLSENVNEWFVIFSLVHKFIIGFAVVLVITGVFMQQTFKVAATDDTIMTMQQTRATQIHRKKMQLLFLAADEDGNGLLDRDEFEKILGEPAVKTWLAAMELQVNDVDKIFSLLCGDGEDDGMTADELVMGVGKLKGAARSLDLHVMMGEQKELMKEVRELNERLAALP